MQQEQGETEVFLKGLKSKKNQEKCKRECMGNIWGSAKEEHRGKKQPQERWEKGLAPTQAELGRQFPPGDVQGF